jgi:hypothetical protein
MATCVMGMHRSGTSMVTGMLARCGMQVGPSHELLGPSGENPTGYFERRAMVLLDDAALDVLGLAWDHVPHAPAAGWLDDPALAPALERATGIVSTFPSDAPWGFKDPRASLLLELWERARGGAPFDCVVCVRNPLDVAASLARRGGMSQRLAMQLWQRYTDAALAHARTRRHVVTHYDAWFEDAGAELDRTCAAIGLDPSDEQRAHALELADDRHRHGASGLAALVRSTAPDEVVALYLEALVQCGPVMGAVAARDELGVVDDGEPFDRDETLAWVREFRTAQVAGA